MLRDNSILNIRPFRNADLPDLVRIWSEHWSTAGPPPYVNQAKFEQAVLARKFFDPETLLVAEAEGSIKGWCHFAPPHCDPSHQDGNVTIVHALCLASSSSDAVALRLLTAIETAPQTTSQIRIGLVRDDQRGYAGLEPIGFGIGIPLSDYRSNSFLQQGGYIPGKTHVRMIASVSQYRPPVNRSALQFRRSTSVICKPRLPKEPRLAASLAHLDIETAALEERGGPPLASVSIWFSDPEAEVMSPSIAILDLCSQHGQGILQPAESYLIGALIHSLNQRNIQTVETAVDSNQTALIEQLQTLQFKVVDEGSCWEKSVHA
ncbi:MAG TPA: hypothetical protein DEF45_16015 [Rhodopirellula sp.]|nr:hypothetical protein [Rhodopirellula sp.]